MPRLLGGAHQQGGVEMRKIKFNDADVRVVLADMHRHSAAIISDSLKVWDSMAGKLPPFDKFVRMYLAEGMRVWRGKARFN